jgi:indole-3-glycerol phosphate synthase
MPVEILNTILSEKKQEVRQKKRSLPVAALRERAAQQKALDFAAALVGEGTRLIAEVKKASPSRGLLRPDFRPVDLATTYARSGAAAVSVLTEASHFQGSLEHLSAVGEAVSLPLLRKDFIFDEYQVYESAASGADALLLIAAILSRGQLEELLAASHNLGLKCLVEVHDENEVEKALRAGAGIIGINNRDLHTFHVDIDTTRRLRPLIPAGHLVVAESGISNRDHIKKMKAWGVNAVLVGEALVTASDIPARIKELML